MPRPSIYKSNLTIFREAVAFAKAHGAPSECIVGLIEAERDALAAKLKVTEHALTHVRNLLLQACANAGVHRTEELGPWVIEARAKIDPPKESAE